MRFKVFSNVEYEVHNESTIILNIHALQTSHQTVIEETFSTTPYIKAEELLSDHGENRFMRLEIPDPCILNIEYSAIVDTTFELIDFEALTDVPISQMEPYILPYLYPSLFCQ